MERRSKCLSANHPNSITTYPVQRSKLDELPNFMRRVLKMIGTVLENFKRSQLFN